MTWCVAPWLAFGEWHRSCGPVLGELPGSNDLRGALQMSGVQDTADMEH